MNKISYLFTLKHLFSIVCILIGFGLNGQVDYNMNMFSNWDDDNLPVRSGGSFSDIWGYVDDNDNEYAIVGGIHNIFFFDVTNPSSPELIVKIEEGTPSGLDLDPSIWRDFKSYEHYVYGVADEGNEGLLVFDMSQAPDTVTLVAQHNGFFNDAHSIYIDEANARLYVTGSSGPSTPNNLIVYGLGNPEVPNELYRGSMAGGYIHDIHVKDNIAYASHGGNGIYMYDVSDLDNIDLLGFLDNYPGAGYNHSSWVTEDDQSLIFCDETHGKKVKIYDISDPDNWVEQDQFDSNLLGSGNSIAHNPFILGNRVFVSYYHDGVQVFDISDPENVVNVAYYDTFTGHTGYGGYDGVWGVYPYLPSGNIIASDITNGLFVLELDIPLLNAEVLDFQPNLKSNGLVELDIEIQNIKGSNKLILEKSQSGTIFTSFFSQELNETNNQKNIVVPDYPASGRVFYKLTILDDEDRETFSLVKTIFINAKDDFSIYPSYASITKPILHIKSGDSNSLEMEVWSLDGAFLGKKEVRSNQIDLSTVISAPGIFQIRLLDNGHLVYLQPILVTD